MYKNLIVFIASSALFACNYLDFDESINKTDEIAYGYFNELSRHVTHIYAQVKVDWGDLNGALLESATDNATYTWQNSKVYDIYNDTWSSINLIDNKWPLYYDAIRATNTFLANFSLANLERFENNANYKEDVEKAKMYPYEVRFLRSFFYFELAKRYRDIPLLTVPYPKEKINSVGQVPFDSVVNFIVKECDEIISVLPVNHRQFYNETGRATRGAAMALKSRVLLYAASPLHNPTNDLSKWEKAAKAANDLITASTVGGWYFLDPNVLLFSNGNDVLRARQLIFERRGSASSSFEETNLPIGFYTAKSGNTPSQNLIDAFEMKDGTPFDWNNPEHAANPYQNRDPRLAKTVIYNESKLSGVVVETFYGGKNGPPIHGTSLTGYYLKKYIDERVSLDPVNPVERPHHYILFRYAEAFLNYAEALNEFKGPDYVDVTFTLSAKDALNKIRSYVKMPLLSDIYSQDLFREKVRNERRVEFAFEDHRFWDIRRWKIGHVVKDVYGISIQKNVSDYIYKKVLIQNRIWEDKMYLYPIPQSEIYVNKNLKQNEGW